MQLLLKTNSDSVGKEVNNFHYEKSFENMTLNKMISRSSHQRCPMKKTVRKNFTIFIGKYLCRSLFLIKLQLPLLHSCTQLRFYPGSNPQVESFRR